MDFEYSTRTRDLLEEIRAFMSERVYPNEATLWEHAQSPNRWTVHPLVEELKRCARSAGLWNLFLPDSDLGAGLANAEYAPLCEEMGRSFWASEVFNCSAPDTGNMEVLARYGSDEQKRRWLTPLLDGSIRSCFAMTEPDVASSDATNIKARVDRDGHEYVLNGRKWWTSGALDPRCELLVFLGRGPQREGAGRYERHSMLLVPRHAPGITTVRSLPVFGYDDAPHGHAELLFENVRVQAENLLLGEGRGFEIAQGRLGPGRIHHCMRLVGLAERALESTCRRAFSRTAFGGPLAEQSITEERIAEARLLIDQARLLTLHAAWRMDTAGNKEARKEIALIKVAAPNMACRVLDWAIQMHGAAGVCDDFGLAYAYAQARALRFADGPDEVHRRQIARLELARHAPQLSRSGSV